MLNDNLYLNVILHFSGHYSHVRRLGSFIAVQHRLHDPLQIPADRQEKLQKRDCQVSQLVSKPGGSTIDIYGFDCRFQQTNITTAK